MKTDYVLFQTLNYFISTDNHWSSSISLQDSVSSEIVLSGWLQLLVRRYRKEGSMWKELLGSVDTFILTSRISCHASRHPILVYFLNGFLSLRNGFVFINTIKKLIHLQIFFFTELKLCHLSRFETPFSGSVCSAFRPTLVVRVITLCTKIVWRYLPSLDCPLFYFIGNKLVEVITSSSHFHVNSNDLGTSEPEACITRNSGAMYK